MHVQASKEIQLGAVGMPIILTIVDPDVLDESGETTPIDISSATERKITVRKPSGTKLVDNQEAEFVTDGTDGKIKYVTKDGDIDETGQWMVQGFILLGSLKSYTSVDYFQVNPNL